VAGSARLRQCDGLQATANGVSKRRPNFHHQLLSTKAVPDVGNDKAFRMQKHTKIQQPRNAPSLLSKIMFCSLKAALLCAGGIHKIRPEFPNALGSSCRRGAETIFLIHASSVHSGSLPVPLQRLPGYVPATRP